MEKDKKNRAVYITPLKGKARNPEHSHCMKNLSKEGKGGLLVSRGFKSSKEPGEGTGDSKEELRLGSEKKREKETTKGFSITPYI